MSLVSNTFNMHSGASDKVGTHEPVEVQPPSPPNQTPLWKIAAVTTIAIGLQFGWALQFSLLTPYVQLLGIPHKWASYIWLCGPISGMIVQPLAGYYSDRCTSRFGRRRPFIAAAAALITIAVVLIGFAADLGRLAGDPLGQTSKPRAITMFVIGFWALDVGNNLLMAPCRALLADMSGGDQRKTRNANATFSLFTQVGSVLGYAAGAYSRLYKIFPFTLTKACDVYCANLKSCFLISITLLLVLTLFALLTVREQVITKLENEEAKKTVPFFGELLSALKRFPRAMWILLLVVSLNSTGFFAFLLYDTDWMGREVYGGKVGTKAYDNGVHAGSLGLMLNSAVGGVAAIAVMIVVRGVRSGNRVWGCSNILLAVCLGLTVWISKAAESHRRHMTVESGGAVVGKPDPGVKAAALTLFAVLGIPQAVTYSIPFALASIYSNSFGGGQGLSMGVMNIAVVIPQLIVSLTSGPWDEVFGGGNLPAFVVGAFAAALSGIFALTLLPSPPTNTDTLSSDVLKIDVASSH